jgi:uncharacterized protein YaaN involved in tellurite resistance
MSKDQRSVKTSVVLLKISRSTKKCLKSNLDLFQELSMYIEAGKNQLKEIEDIVIPQAQSESRRIKLRDAQKANDMAAYANNFDKRSMIWNLPMISIQRGRRSDLPSDNGSLMVQKITLPCQYHSPSEKSSAAAPASLIRSRQWRHSAK